MCADFQEIMVVKQSENFCLGEESQVMSNNLSFF